METTENQNINLLQVLVLEDHRVDTPVRFSTTLHFDMEPLLVTLLLEAPQSAKSGPRHLQKEPLARIIAPSSARFNQKSEQPDRHPLVKVQCNAERTSHPLQVPSPGASLHCCFSSTSATEQRRVHHHYSVNPNWSLLGQLRPVSPCTAEILGATPRLLVLASLP